MAQGDVTRTGRLARFFGPRLMPITLLVGIDGTSGHAVSSEQREALEPLAPGRRRRNEPCRRAGSTYTDSAAAPLDSASAVVGLNAGGTMGTGSPIFFTTHPCLLIRISSLSFNC